LRDARSNTIARISVRIFLLLAAVCVFLGGSASLPSPGAIDQSRVRELLTGIFEDVGAILSSFEGGPEDPKGPVNDRNALASASARIDSATQKAYQLASELGRLQGQTRDPRGP
jgi:hypothetical protein